MTARTRTAMVPWLLAGAALPAAGYLAMTAYAWWRYGSPPRPNAEQDDALLNALIPRYDIVERHQIHVNAPAATALRAAAEADLFASPMVRGVFRTRELVMRAAPGAAAPPRGLIALAKSLGWGVLAESAGTEIVMGAVTQPWRPNVVFRSLPAAQFRSFSEPDYVKIAWTLRADPVTGERSIFRTETRAVATDAAAREKFRRYWAFVSPGVWVIRRLSLRPIRRRAEEVRTKN